MEGSYREAYRLASEFLENRDVRLHWRTPTKLFKAMGWVLIEYSKKEEPNLTTDAYSSYKNNTFFILSCIENHARRVNYNYHHEAGHIIAAHPLLYGDRLCKSCGDNTFLEREATVIGRNVFFPACLAIHLLKKLGTSKLELIKKYYSDKYSLSPDYVNVRFNYLKNDTENMKYPNWYEEEKEKELIYFKAWCLNQEDRLIRKKEYGNNRII